MRTYLLTFYTNKAANGYAVINANTSKLALDILKTQGRFIDSGYNIARILYLDHSINGIAIVNEGIVTSGLSAYEIAVKYGYKGTELEWINSLNVPSSGGSGSSSGTIIDETVLHKGDNVSELINDANYTVNEGAEKLPSVISANDSVVYLTIGGKKYMLLAVDLDKPVEKPSITNIVYNYDNNGGGTATIIFDRNVYAAYGTEEIIVNLNGVYKNTLSIPLTLNNNSSVIIKAVAKANGIYSDTFTLEVILINKVATPKVELIGNILSDEIYLSISGFGNYKVNEASSTNKYSVTGNGTYKILSTYPDLIDSEVVTINVNLTCPSLEYLVEGKILNGTYSTTLLNYDESKKVTLYASRLKNVTIEKSTNNSTWTSITSDSYTEHTADGTIYWRVTRGTFTSSSGNITWKVRHLPSPTVEIKNGDNTFPTRVYAATKNINTPTESVLWVMYNTSSIPGTYLYSTSNNSYSNVVKAESVNSEGHVYVHVHAVVKKEGWYNSPDAEVVIELNKISNAFYGLFSAGELLTETSILALNTKSISSISSITLNFGKFDGKYPVFVIANPLMDSSTKFTLKGVLTPQGNSYQASDYTLTSIKVLGNNCTAILWNNEASAISDALTIVYKFG